MTNEPHESSAQPRTPKPWLLLGVATAATRATILLFEKVLAWLRRLKTTDDSAITMLPLTPRYEAEKHGVYLYALERALQSRNEPVLNVALTGSYGVGKSSILEEVARRHRRKAIVISLSTLGFPDELDAPSEAAAATSTSKTNRIQKEIVKQLLYSQDPVKMPGSRYRRMTRFRFWRELGLAALLTVPVTLVFYLTGWTESIAKLIPLPAEWALLVHGVVFVAAVMLILGFRVVFHNRIQIDKITAGSATISLSAKSATFFDEYLDEIVYFFEVIKRDVVIFEDIDRFDDAHIFETLRSLNSILNGAKQLKRRRIRFVYAIKDSIFDELGTRAAREELDDSGPLPARAVNEDSAEAEVARANRTKFFDLVIPVVPFITHRSARDLIVETMRDVDFGLSTDLIDLAARHVADMRLIKNIRNEFAIFKRQVIDTGDLELDHNKLFAMMLYKSTHLSDFELIKLGSSNLDKLYQDSRDLVTTNVKALNATIRHARMARSKARISAEHSGALGLLLLDHTKLTLWGRGLSIHLFTVNQKQFTEDTIRTAEFWDELSTTDGTLSVAYSHPNYGGHRMLELTRAGIAKALGEPISSKKWVDVERARLDGEIRDALADREVLTHADMSGLMGRSETLKRGGTSLTFAQIAKQQLKSELAEQLVAAGYIDRNFTLYTSTFHGMRISANATNFIMKNIEPNVTDMLFTLTGDDVDAIIREKGQTVLREQSAYNISILDRLLADAPDSASILAGQLKTYGDREREFLLAYLEDGSNREALVNELAGNWSSILTTLIADAQLDEPTGLQLVNSALLALTSDVDYVISDAVQDYMARNYASLAAFTSDGTTQPQATRIAALVKKAGVKLPLIDALGANVLRAIVADGSYDLNRENLRTALGPDHVLNLDAIARASEAIYQRVLGDIPGYLAALDENLPTVVSASLFIDTIKDVSEADEDQLPAIISRSAETCHIAELPSVPQSAWPSLADELRFPATFANVRAYIDEYGMDVSLVAVLRDAGEIDAHEGAEESAKLEIALAILLAKNEIPSPSFRADLVRGLALKSHIPASAVPKESGELVGHLIAANVVADDADTFAIINMTDVAGLAFTISKSSAFAEFMTPTQVTHQVVAALISSAAVPTAVKDAIVDRFDEFTAGASSVALAAVADYALRRGKNLTFPEVTRLATERVNAMIVLQLLQPHLPSLTLAELSPVLKAVGGRYAEMTEANGKRPSIGNTDADRALADRLRMLGVVSSLEQRGTELKVNMRRH